MNEQPHRSRNLVCSLVSFAPGGEITPEQETALRQVVAFLVQRLHITLFVTDRSMCDTPLVRLVLNLSDTELHHTSVGVYAHCAKGDRAARAALKAQLIPPFSQVFPIDTKAAGTEQTRCTVTDMLCRTDFAICGNGSDREQINALLADVDEMIRLKHARPLKILDISSEPKAVSAGSV